MIILAYDTETTGLDVTKDRVIEVGMILYTTTRRRVLEATSFLVKSDKALDDEITNVTGITQSMLDRFGYDSDTAFDTVTEWFNQAEALVTQNGPRFDRRITESWGKQHNKTLQEKLWIDTYSDIPGVEGKKLEYMAADEGFLPMDKHSALADAQTALRIFSNHVGDINGIVERAKSPTLVIQSHQDRSNNADAKKLKFRWNPDAKIWWKAVKEMDLEGFAKTCPFDVSVNDQYSLDELWD